MTDIKKDVTILAIESSCDETAASVVVNGRKVLSNVISSQIDIHTLYGGVVPEIASRKHTERITQVIREGLEEAGKTLEDLDAIAVTYGPGLVGPLLIGVSAAKGLSFATGIPVQSATVSATVSSVSTSAWLPLLLRLTCRFSSFCSRADCSSCRTFA